MLFIILLVAFVSVSVFSLCSERIQEKIVAWVKDTCKWALVCGLVVATFFAMFILLPPAKAEEAEFYDIVAIVTNIEEDEQYLGNKLVTDVVVEVDDLDNLWAYYELTSDVEFDCDKELNNEALRFIVDNNILAETLRDYPLTEGRIVVMRMWTCGTDNIEDDEILGVYYTEFIAL